MTMIANHVDDMSRTELVALVRRLRDERDNAAKLALLFLDHWSTSAESDYKSLVDSNLTQSQVQAFNTLADYAVAQGWVELESPVVN